MRRAARQMQDTICKTPLLLMAAMKSLRRARPVLGQRGTKLSQGDKHDKKMTFFVSTSRASDKRESDLRLRKNTKHTHFFR